LISSATRAEQRAFLESLTNDQVRALPFLWDFWAMPHQVAPEGDWKTWVILGGRGAGKTRAGAEWVRAQVEGSGPGDPGRAKRIALVGETYDQARDVMVFGESGILACTPADRRPRWIAGRRCLVWPNGAEAQVFSAHDFEGLRGPQFDAAWVDELGCAAVDKGANEPNRFLDPKSSESSLPKHSSGARDDLMQMQYLTAMAEFWGDGANNPFSSAYGGPMVATDRMFVWAWDARPYPYFPANGEVWSDGGNYAKGHWLNGRVSARGLGNVIVDLCVEAGVSDVDVAEVRGLVRGYALGGGETAREALQPLLLAFGLDAVERDGRLVFRNRDGLSGRSLMEAELARGEAPALLTRGRMPEAEVSGRVRLSYVEADGDYETRGTESIFPGEATVSVARSEVPLALTAGEARAIVERWLAEARVARDSASFALPPSSEVVAGDVVTLAGDAWRVDRVEEAGLKLIEAVRVERGVYRGFATEDAVPALPPVVAPLPVWAEVFDLPLLTGSEDPAAPYVAASASPWPGAVAVYSSLDGQAWSYEAELSRRAVMGLTVSDLAAAVPGLPQRGAGVDVQFVGGAPGSIDDLSLFAGGNAAALSDGSGLWEVLQFRDAELLGPDLWRLSHLLRGQAGTEGAMQPVWPAGSTLVFLDAAAQQISVPSSLRGVTRRYRVGSAARPVDHPSFLEITHAAGAVGLRPYAPAHLRAVPDGSGGHGVSWIRRTRIEGDRWDLPDVPLGEASEIYRVRVLSSGQVAREETVTSPGWTYDAAKRAGDGVALPFTVEVAQVSDLYGAGTNARIVIDA
jgi:hypothetical protein